MVKTIEQSVATKTQVENLLIEIKNDLIAIGRNLPSKDDFTAGITDLRVHLDSRLDLLVTRAEFHDRLEAVEKRVTDRVTEMENQFSKQMSVMENLAQEILSAVSPAEASRVFPSSNQWSIIATWSKRHE